MTGCIFGGIGKTLSKGPARLKLWQVAIDLGRPRTFRELFSAAPTSCTNARDRRELSSVSPARAKGEDNETPAKKPFIVGRLNARTTVVAPHLFWFETES
jgi:hypothetical protein